MNGIEAFLEILAQAGVRYLFGNPGTTELPLNDALAADDRFQYILGVQEIPVTAMADGYAMAGGEIGVVNLHIAAGLGNAMGMIYNAHCEGTPLLLTAGQQDRRLRFDEPVLAGDLVEVARPWTKWAVEVQRVEDLPNAVRRAVQIATTPPTGPVFLSLPVDLQMEPCQGLDLSPPQTLDRHVRPATAALERAAEVLREAKKPVILAGSRVVEAGASEELTALAELLGAPVFAEGTSSHGRLPMASNHPLYQSVLPYWSPEIRETLQEFDVAFAVGLNVLRLYIHRQPERPLPEHLRLFHMDSSPEEIGKNFPVEVGLWCDPLSGLQELHTVLSSRLEEDQRQAVGQRIADYAEQKQQRQTQLREEIQTQQAARPMTPLALMGALADALPENVAVVEEAITTHQNVFERLGVLRDPKAFFAHRGWALGWGVGCSLGVKLAWPDRPVLGVIGDGSALYGIQALWSAARYQIPVTWVIANNAQYKILKVCGDVLDLPGLKDPACPGLDIVRPQVDYVALARSFGVASQRVETPEELRQAVAESLAGDRPQLIEAPIG